MNKITRTQAPVRQASHAAWALRTTALLLASAGFSPATQALESYVTWDNFNSSTSIDATRWLATERSRKVEGGQLRFIQRDLGSQYSNSGVFSNSWGENLTNPAPVTQLKATLTVNGFDVTGCATNPTDVSTLQARLVGGFFNAGPGVPTSRINDVGATIRLKRDSNSPDGAGVLRVQGTVFQCTTSDCNYGSIDLGSVDLGTATLGQAVVLRMDWEQSKKRFSFYRDSDPVQRVTYTASDSLPPYAVFRQIGTRTTVANCLGAARTQGFMDASFDKVYVNSSALP